MRLDQLALPSKIAYSLLLVCIGLGLLAAQSYLIFTMSPKGEKLPDVQTIQKHFFVEKIPILRKAIDGSMAEYVESEEHRQVFLEFMEKKAPEELFQGKLKTILEYSCIDCHSKGGDAAFADFKDYEVFKEKAIFSYRPYVKARLRIAHPHLLAIPLFLFLCVAGLAFTPINDRLKSVLMGLPLLGVLLDIPFWFVAMKYKWAAYFIMVGGAMSSLGCALAILLNLYYCWIYDQRKCDGP